MDYKTKCQKIVDRLIRKSFPSLRNENIRIKEISNSLFWWAGGFVLKWKGDYLIILNEKFRKVKNKPLVGALCHELCHIEDYKKRKVGSNPFYYAKEWLSWAFNTPFSRKLEREAEIQAIKKGYSKELYSFALVREKIYPKQSVKKLQPRGYLSPEEIKAYARKRN